MIALSKKHGGPEAYSSGLRLEKAGGKVRQQICSDKAFVSLRSTPVGYRGVRRLRGSGPRDASVCQKDAQQSRFGETRFHQRFQYPEARRHTGLGLSNHSGNLLVRPPGLLNPVCPRIWSSLTVVTDGPTTGRPFGSSSFQLATTAHIVFAWLKS